MRYRTLQIVVDFVQQLNTKRNIVNCASVGGGLVNLYRLKLTEMSPDGVALYVSDFEHLKGTVE